MFIDLEIKINWKKEFLPEDMKDTLSDIHVITLDLEKDLPKESHFNIDLFVKDFAKENIKLLENQPFSAIVSYMVIPNYKYMYFSGNKTKILTSYLTQDAFIEFINFCKLFSSNLIPQDKAYWDQYEIDNFLKAYLFFRDALSELKILDFYQVNIDTFETEALVKKEGVMSFYKIDHLDFSLDEILKDFVNKESFKDVRETINPDQERLPFQKEIDKFIKEERMEKYKNFDIKDFLKRIPSLEMEDMMKHISEVDFINNLFRAKDHLEESFALKIQDVSQESDNPRLHINLIDFDLKNGHLLSNILKLDYVKYDNLSHYEFLVDDLIVNINHIIAQGYKEFIVASK